jgi:hypothetical protein
MIGNTLGFKDNSRRDFEAKRGKINFGLRNGVYLCVLV